MKFNCSKMVDNSRQMATHCFLQFFLLTLRDFSAWGPQLAAFVKWTDRHNHAWLKFEDNDLQPNWLSKLTALPGRINVGIRVGGLGAKPPGKFWQHDRYFGSEKPPDSIQTFWDDTTCFCSEGLSRSKAYHVKLDPLTSSSKFSMNLPLQ